jgi:hypothetical protein
MFKTLKQYKLANKINKQKMLHAFCNNSVPHHRGFNVSELTQMGIPVLPICDQQLKKRTYEYNSSILNMTSNKSIRILQE